MRIFNSLRLHKKTWLPDVILPQLILLGCILLQGSLTLIFALTLRYNINTSGFDGSVFAQLMDNLLHGKGLISSINPPYIAQPWLGFHFSPIFYLFAPIYSLFPYIETFLVIGSYAAALAAWPIFLAARTILKNSWQALAMAVLYLINPYILNPAVWDFHEVYLAPLCIATMLWALLHRKRNTMLVLCIVLLCIKEHYGLTVAGFGLLWAWYWKEKVFGLGVCAFGFLMFGIVIGIVMPHFNPHHIPAMMDTTSGRDRYSWLQHPFSKEGPIANIVIMGLRYILLLCLPFLFSPLAAIPWLLPGLADISANIAATESMMRSPNSYHSMTLIPVVIIACCVAIRKHCNTTGMKINQGQALWAIVLMSSCYSYAFSALPLPGAKNVWEFSSPRVRYTDEDARAISTINAIIPADAIVSGQSSAIPHLTPRYEMYAFPGRFEDADYIVLHLRFPFTHSIHVFGNPFGYHPDRYFEAVDQLFSNPEWKIEFSANRWVLLKRHGVDIPEERQAAVNALTEIRQEFKNALDNATPIR